MSGERKDDWIEWKGGECPLHGDKKIQVRLRCGAMNRSLARHYEWHHVVGHVEAFADIVAYREIAK